MHTRTILESATDSATRLARLLGRRDQVEGHRGIALEKLAALEEHCGSLTLDQTGTDSDLLWQAAWQLGRAAKHAQAVFSRAGAIGLYGPAQERAVAQALRGIKARGNTLLRIQKHLVAAR
jgi:hypothetical protein